MNEANKRRTKNERDFLLSFFDGIEGYAEIEVNGFNLIKQLNSKTSEYNVAIHTKESIKRVKNFRRFRNSFATANTRGNKGERV